MPEPSGWELLKLHLQQSEYLHVLLNPLPIYGLGAGLLAMVVALGLRHRRAEIVALVVVFVSALSAWPVGVLGEQGYDRMLAVADEAGNAWLDLHKARAESLLWVFYALAALSVVAVFVPMKWPRMARPLFVAVLLWGLAAFGCGGWIGYAGGKVRHSEFRYGPPPALPSPSP